jgi:DNA-binding NarL/FixJ family response regulator
VVSADPLARTALARALMGEPGLEVSGRAAPGADLTEALNRLRPDLVLFDAGLSTEAATDTPAELPAGKTLWLVPGPEAAAWALRSGALGVLRRDAEPERLAAALRTCAEGLAVWDPELLAAALPADPPSARPGGDLTPREREVLELLARGLSNKAIAEALSISEHTAKFHVNALLSKLGAQSRTEVVVRAARRGWLTL